MVAPAFVFLAEAGEANGAMIARCAKEALAGGPMGAELRGAWYQTFLAPWGREGQLRYGRTSCGIFAATLWLWAGLRRFTLPWRLDGSWGITSWLGITFAHASWAPWGTAEPEAGDAVYRDYTAATTPDGHVQVLVEGAGELWTTAEGGGSLEAKRDRERMLPMTPQQIRATNGTLCRLSDGPKNVAAKDKRGRRPIGFWRAKMLARVST